MGAAVWALLKLRQKPGCLVALGEDSRADSI